MQNFIFVKEAAERTTTSGSAVDHLALRIPGTQDNPQDWLILASAEIGGGNGGASLHSTYVKLNFQIGGSTEWACTNLTNGGGVHAVPDNPFDRPMFVGYIKNFGGGSGATTYTECKFQFSKDAGSHSAVIRNAAILAIRIPELIRESIIYQTETGSPLVNLSTTETAFGAITFVPKKGKYLVITQAQLDFTATSSESADIWTEVYQSSNASTESGATAKLISQNCITKDPSLGNGLQYYTIFGDATTSTIKYPVSSMSIIDFENEPATVVMKCRGSGTTPDITKSTVIVVPMDNLYPYKYIYSEPGIEIPNASATYTNVIGPLSVGVEGKKSFVITHGNGSANLGTAPGFAYCYSKITADSGDLTTEIVAAGNVLYSSHGLNSLHMVSDTDNITVKMRELVSLTVLNVPYASNGLILAFTDMQSNQTSETVEKEIIIHQDIAIPQVRNYIDEPTIKALKGVAEEGRPVYTNVEVNIADSNPNLVNIAASDTSFKLVGTTYTRDA